MFFIKGIMRIKGCQTCEPVEQVPTLKFDSAFSRRRYEVKVKLLLRLLILTDSCLLVSTIIF